mmetsp:Transcript_147366/g.257581  ORF Transcript_147366/g.257581 Transcript_147366/m.257581 type:complete len:247 (+) Transcript_147366:837-1577(+)
MMLLLPFETPDGVVAGVQVNLVKRGLVRPSMVSKAWQPIRLYSADGSAMKGGDEMVMGRIEMQAVDSKRVWWGSVAVGPSGQVSFATTAYLADIQPDIILSHPWMVNNRLWAASPYNCLFREVLWTVQFLLEPKWDYTLGWPSEGTLVARFWPTWNLLITLTPPLWHSQETSRSTQAVRQFQKRGPSEGVVGGRLPGTSIYQKGVHTRANLRVGVPKTRVTSTFGQCYKPPDPENVGENRPSPKVF